MTKDNKALRLQKMSRSIRPTLHPWQQCFTMDKGSSKGSFSYVLSKRFLESYYYLSAKVLWRKQNMGKMPGSNRTSRLRKKRRTKLIKWHKEQN